MSCRRMVLPFFLTAMVCVPQGALEAQDIRALSPPLAGQNFTPQNRTVLYSSPQNGLIRQQKPMAIVVPSDGAVDVFPLAPSGTDYVAGQPAQTQDLMIRQTRDVVQGSGVTKWIEVTGAGQTGWTPYDPGNLAPLMPAQQ